MRTQIVSGNKTTEAMKKLFYTLIAAGAVFSLTVSCEKELESSNEETTNQVVNSNIPTEIVAVINPDDVTTKTQYESNTTFGWTSGDQVRMPVVKWSGANGTGSITACDYYTFTTSATTGDASATFIRNGGSDNMESYDPNPSGTAGSWSSMGYLVYPNALVNGKKYSGTVPVLNLPASITYNSTNPLDGGVVPMIGRKDGETYKFSTAVGIIKLTISRAPSDAKKIVLTSATKAIAGEFPISNVDATVSQITLDTQTNGTNTITLTGLSLTAGESYDFYFPVPVGTYAANDLSVSILASGDVPLLEKTITKSLTIARNEVLAIPALSYEQPVYIDGNLSAPVLHTVNPSGSSMVRVHIKTEKLTAANYDYNEWKDGNRFSASSSYNCTDLTNKSSVVFLTSAGKYYLQYVVLKSGFSGIPTSLSNENVMAYGSVPFYFAPSGNKIPVADTWLDVPYVSTSEGSAANLVDGTIAYWHSPYGSENPARNATYGQIISIDLNQGSLTTKGDFYFSFQTRYGALNDHAKSMNVYVSNVPWDDEGFDAGKVLVGSTANALAGIDPYDGVWIKEPIVCTHQDDNNYCYITVSILESVKNGSIYDLRTGGCTHMAEIEFYTK